MQTNICTIFKKQGDIPRPPATYVMIEESPGNIDDDWLVEDPDTPTVWTDMPASYHGQRCRILFCDGHADVCKWTDKQVLKQADVFTISDPHSGDVAWQLGIGAIIAAPIN